MKLRYKYRVYPDDQQKIALAQLFGCCRYVFNVSLAFCKEQYLETKKKPSSGILSKRLTNLKKQKDTLWLKEVSAIPLQQSLRDLEVAYSNFFNSVTGKRKGKKVKPPKFKKRSSKQSAKFTSNGFKILSPSGKLYLPKIGNVDVVWSRELPDTPSSVTIIKDSANRYFVSFVVEFDPPALAQSENSVGLDLGITDFVTTSSGEKVKAPKPLKKKLTRLRRLQKNLSGKKKGSKRYESARLKLAKLHAKISDVRTDFLHKLSSRIVNENQVIVLEDLNVSGMVKNRKLSRAISDLGWRTFRSMLEAKCVIYGRDFRVIDRWTPTSQICSACGFRGGKKELKVRAWTCVNCGEVHERDLNAAKNILVAGGHS
ncbi:transposase, IS605 OrfB family [Cyanobacterium stanieri PCC 7202]|uniref:Transposase, IS605 OrfB family n=1 Tax=Cyanobacterium stanieri (strain ATCC 29140 / PCC 7202) TaxID=292563 RepID=K9YIE0_CYASC|nr:transposase, IS605 OrfB family [Cyanobacterium stanieri PCC 7202]